MAAVIKLKRGTSTPSTSDIASGEVAVDTSAQKFYINDSGTVKEIGGGGGVTSDAQYNTKAGTNSGDSFSGTGAQFNNLFGYNTGTAITSGDGNTAFGAQAGESITTNSYTTMIGYKAGQLNTAHWNTAVGGECMDANTSGTKNTAVGAMGLSACVTGTDNTVSGYAAGRYITGNDNTCIGSEAGDALTTGSNDLILGHGAEASAVDTSNEITLGNTAITKFRIPGLGFELDTDSSSGFILDFGSVA